MMAEKVAVGRGREKKKKKEKKRRENTHSDQNAGMAERASTPSSICLSDPQGPDEVIAREGAQSSIKKGVYLGSIDDRARERRGAHPFLTRRSSSLTLLARGEY